MEKKILGYGPLVINADFGQSFGFVNGTR
jgi:hypothetical protein